MVSLLWESAATTSVSVTKVRMEEREGEEKRMFFFQESHSDWSVSHLWCSTRMRGTVTGAITCVTSAGSARSVANTEQPETQIFQTFQ